MKKQTNKINIVSSVLWAAAIIAGAILKAPVFFTLVLLPLLACSSLAATEIIGRGFKASAETCP